MRCKNCKWWGITPGWMEESDDIDARNNIPGDTTHKNCEHPKVGTGPEFGCIYFEFRQYLENKMSEKLYAVYVSGPDDIFAAPSKGAAEAKALDINNSIPPETAAEAGVIEWPFDDLSHARDVKNFDDIYA